MINLASRLGANVVVAMNYAWVLMMLPLGVFGMAVARAWFPQFAAAAMDGPTPELARQLTAAIRTVLFFLLPAAAGLMLFAPLVVATLFERGAFDAASTELTAWALLFFAVGLAGHGAVEVLNRGFFALKDTRTPVLIGIVSMGLGIVLAALLMRPLAQGGLALGISLAVLLEAVWLWVLLARRVPDFRFLTGMLPLLLCTLLAAGVSGARSSGWFRSPVRRPSSASSFTAPCYMGLRPLRAAPRCAGGADRVAKAAVASAENRKRHSAMKCSHSPSEYGSRNGTLQRTAADSRKRTALLFALTAYPVLSH